MPPNPLFWETFILFSFLIVNRKHHFPYYLLSSNLIVLYPVILEKKWQQIVLKGKMRHIKNFFQEFI